eukprot:gnl/Spiro4/4736_TR2367_c0_g1_i1.p2 gnl/Spiro4/4736_TR2367_c0_g1~~gnl/Spiro4/4736_TR2367_c0_g1_i1.p2  ORF type:complete len:188 (+),score=71.12 gnl/Spiro4/4736_TR2367_c0_g1_i1:98-661(+)
MESNLIKAVILGGGAVGKSALSIQFVHNRFEADYDPTIEDCYRTQCTVDNETVLMEIVDTAGQEEFRALRDQYIRSGLGFLLVFSITSRHSFDEIPSFRENIIRVKGESDVPMVIMGNKCDLASERQVSYNEFKDLATSYDCPFFECSAKDRFNVQKGFHVLVSQIRKFNARHNVSKKKKKFKCDVL